jgi:hypothetical protein
MSPAKDQIGISSIGVQSIMPTTGTPRRATKRKPEDERDTNSARTKHDQASFDTGSDIGRLVDKLV